MTAAFVQATKHHPVTALLCRYKQPNNWQRVYCVPNLVKMSPARWYEPNGPWDPREPLPAPPEIHTKMPVLLLSPAPPRPPLTMLSRPPLPSIVSPASAKHFSAPCRAATSGGTLSYAAVRSSLPRLAAAAAESPASGPSDPTPLYSEDEAERAKLAQVPLLLRWSVELHLARASRMSLPLFTFFFSSYRLAKN
jgi:hypothetical protein